MQKGRSPQGGAAFFVGAGKEEKMRRQWLTGQHPTRMIEEGKEQYRRFLDYRERRAEIAQTLRFFESLGQPLSTREIEILAEEEER